MDQKIENLDREKEEAGKEGKEKKVREGGREGGSEGGREEERNVWGIGT
jgi:hypothetical protein